MAKTGVVWESIFAEHTMGAMHPESPARILAVKEVLENTTAGKNAVKIKSRPATKGELAWVHDPEYIDRMEATKGKSVYLDPDTSTSPATWDAALLASGGLMSCVDAVCKKEVDNAFAFVRPPGHHAEAAKAMGFCIFNNVAIAAEHAIKKHGVGKVAIVDFDVHHGNGTQNAFYNRSDVFYISTHRWPFYPGTGSREEHGEGEGKGYTLNVPFAGGADDEEFKRVYNDIVIPVILEYGPNLILLSAGYDAHRQDPIGGLNVSTEAFGWLTKRFVETAKNCCDGRLVMVLEGGYNIDALKECVEGALEILEG